MVNKKVGFVSILGLAVIMSIVATYVYLFSYLNKSVTMKDPFLMQIFKDVKEIEKHEIEKEKNILYSKDFIIITVNHDLKVHGMFCSKGNYKYGGIGEYNDKYVMAYVDKKGVHLNPLLIRSGEYQKIHILSPLTRGIVVLTPMDNDLYIEGCNYEKVYDYPFNRYAHILAYNINTKGCKVLTSKRIFINEYSKPIDVSFIRLNLLSLINKEEIPLEILLMPQQKFQEISNEITSLLSNKISFINSEDIVPYLQEYDDAREKMEDLLFIPDKEAEIIFGDIRELNKNEKKVLFEALDKRKEIKDIVSNMPEENTKNIDLTKVDELYTKIMKYSGKVDRYLRTDITKILGKYSPDKINAIFSLLDECSYGTKQIILSLLEKYPLDSLLSMSNEELSTKISQLNMDMKEVNIKNIRDKIQKLNSIGISTGDLVKLIKIDTQEGDPGKYIDIPEVIKLSRVTSQFYSLDEIKEIYSRCSKIKNYSKLLDLMDKTELSFSPHYDVKTAYDRMDNFGIFENSLKGINEEKIKEVNDTLKDMGMNKGEIDKIKDIFLKGNIKSVKDLENLKNIYDQINNKDYSSLIDKILSYPSLTDQLVSSLSFNLMAGLGLNLITKTCSYTTSQKLFDFNLAVKGYTLLKHGFDVKRVRDLILYRTNMLQYNNIINAVSQLKNVDLTDIKECSKLMDIKKIVLGILYTSQQIKSKNIDYLSACYYNDFYDTSFEGFLFNKSGNLSIAVFKRSYNKDYENYFATYNPYYILDSSLPLFKEYDAALSYLNENEDILLDIRKELSQKIKTLKENQFEYEEIKCGKCSFAPNPLRRIKNKELENIAEKIVEKYRNKIHLEVVNVEVKETVKDLSKEETLPCTCLSLKGSGYLKLCKTKYIVNRGGKIYLKYTYDNIDFIIIMDLN